MSTPTNAISQSSPNDNVTQPSPAVQLAAGCAAAPDLSAEDMFRAKTPGGSGRSSSTSGHSNTSKTHRIRQLLSGLDSKKREARQSVDTNTGVQNTQPSSEQDSSAIPSLELFPIPGTGDESGLQGDEDDQKSTDQERKCTGSEMDSKLESASFTLRAFCDTLRSIVSATYKWSKDNPTMATGITGVLLGSALTYYAVGSQGETDELRDVIQELKRDRWSNTEFERVMGQVLAACESGVRGGG